MKLHNTNEIMLGSNKTSTKFTIATSAKAFKVLSQNLYTNQIRAIIRELSCNAADAHTLLGHFKPFDITLPSVLDTRFIIRDYGPGLSDDDVTHMYTTYFESTKSDSNDFIGALGLGSKSPFGYTETFSIVSRFKGRARGYTACLDNGEPSLIPTFDVEDDSPSGLEITVPVLEKDVSRWHHEAQYVYATFCDIKPNFVGPQIQVNYLPTDEYFFADSGLSVDSTEVYAIMGKIRYPLKSANFDFSGIRALGEAGKMFIRFKLGELDIAPSREEISYDDDTVNNIKRRAEEITKEIYAEIQKEIDDIDSERGVLRYVNSKYYRLSEYLKNSFESKKFGPIKDLYLKYNVYPDLYLHGYYICDNPKLVRISNANRSSTKYKQTLSSVFHFNVENLVVIIDDCKGKDKIATIRGMKSNFVHESLCVVLKDTETETLEQIKDFMGDDVSVYNLSYLRTKYKASKPAEVRPRASNVQIWSMKEDKWNKYFSKKDLYLTASEVRSIKGPILYSFDNSIICSDKNRSYIANRLIINMCEFLGIQEFHVIRPAAFKYVEGKNMVDTLSEKIRACNLSKNDIPIEYDSEFLNYSVLKELPWLKQLLVNQKYKSALNLSSYLELKRILLRSDKELNDELEALESEAESDFEKSEELIREKYPVLYYYVFNLPELTEKQIEIINTYLKPKEL
ncbi:RIIA protein [Proteus phage SJ_PmiM]|nr:RIIA protein [Proteus phage SJ_PmiM]